MYCSWLVFLRDGDTGSASGTRRKEGNYGCRRTPGRSYLPGLLGLLTSGGGGLLRGGGLGGAASGASDIVDDTNPAMHCGPAALKLKVKN